MPELAFWALAIVGTLAVGTSAADVVHASDDLYAFVRATAKQAAIAKIGGDSQDYQRAFTLARDEHGVVGAASFQVLSAGEKPTIPTGTIAVAIIHYAGQCEAPFGDDDFYARPGTLTVFVIGHSGRFWEIGKVDETLSVREVTGPSSFGPWEPYQQDASRYANYKCG